MGNEARANQFPFSNHHFNALKQVKSGEFAGRVALMDQTYQIHGGCNPNAVELVFPEGPDGPLDEDMLELILNNFNAWHETD